MALQSFSFQDTELEKKKITIHGKCLRSGKVNDSGTFSKHTLQIELECISNYFSLRY